MKKCSKGEDIKTLENSRDKIRQVLKEDENGTEELKTNPATLARTMPMERFQIRHIQN